MIECKYCGWCEESGVAHDCRRQLHAEIERLQAESTAVKVEWKENADSLNAEIERLKAENAELRGLVNTAGWREKVRKLMEEDKSDE